MLELIGTIVLYGLTGIAALLAILLVVLTVGDIVKGNMKLW